MRGSLTVAEGTTVLTAGSTGGATVVLRRLACPYMPEQPTATLPNYNPYITVDYVQNVTAQDNRFLDGTGATPPAPARDWTKAFAVGRRQPYAAAQLTPQTPGTTVAYAATFPTLPMGGAGNDTLNVDSTIGFPPSGSININIGGTQTTIMYTGMNAANTAFTGCTGGAGTLATGQLVTSLSGTVVTGFAGTPKPLTTFFRQNTIEYTTPSTITTVTLPSNGTTLPLAGGNIYVASTNGFPGAGTAIINFGGTATQISYTGLGVDANGPKLIGCTGGSGTLTTGNPVRPVTIGQTLDMPFDWLTHLDRPVVNAQELQHVSAYRPHELTQQFITTSKFAHRAPWTDEQAMIFRVLDHLGVPSNLNGTTPGGRVPGKINLNTLNEVEIWRALCDQIGGFSSFSAADVDLIYNRLMQTRTAPGVGGSPSLNDVPFRSFAGAWVQSGDRQYPNGAGRMDTVVRADPVTSTQSLFQVSSATQPNQQNELLQKIYNNFTTTSNSFAVWLTVGFFDVDDSVTPPRIGAEIGRDQSRHIRHRMFAIVDRSAMSQAQPTSLTPMSTAVSAASNGVTLPAGAAFTINVASTLNPNNGSVGFAPSGAICVYIGAAPTLVNYTAYNGTQFSGCTIAGTSPGGTLATGMVITPAPGMRFEVTLSGMALNTMVGNHLDFGPDPVTGQSEVVTVTTINAPNPNFPVISATFTKAFNAQTPVTFRGNPGPWPRQLSSFLTAAVPAGSGSVVVSGNVSNVMSGQQVTVGPDPVTGLSETITLSNLIGQPICGVDMTNAATPTLRFTGTLVNAYNANTPITWTSVPPFNPLTAFPGVSPTLYSPRNDSAVVPHFSIIQ
jgi:hypothetical protein